MTQKLQTTLSRRERLIMDILYRLGRATGADVMAALPGDPSYSTVRTQLRVLERKGHVRPLIPDPRSLIPECYFYNITATKITLVGAAVKPPSAASRRRGKSTGAKV